MKKITRQQLFEWIKDSTHGLNCIVFGCRNPPGCMCTCSYHYCKEHFGGKAPKQLDPHTPEFDRKWGRENLRKFLNES